MFNVKIFGLINKRFFYTNKMWPPCRFYFLIIIFFFASAISVLAQEITLSGTVSDSTSHAPLIGATIKLTDEKDTSKVLYTSTNLNGLFTFTHIPPSSYELEISFIGYRNWSKLLNDQTKSYELGTIYLKPSMAEMNEITVTGKISSINQKGDTTQFNANAFQTNSDASAGDLLAKLPGVTIENGTVTAQGETVQKILINGKPYFGDDPTMALDNLPADAIDSIEVYDKMSSQAEFTGFDDGQTIKTINIILKKNKSGRKFGRIYAGYGTNMRNSEGGNFNLFNNNRSISVIGLSNNVNEQNFSTQDILDVINNSSSKNSGGNRGQRNGLNGNFFVGKRNGISTTHSIGINYNDYWGKKITLNGSYFFNMSQNNDIRKLNRTYFLTNNTNQYYDQNNSINSSNYNNRIYMRINYDINKNNSILIKPKLYFQNYSSFNGLYGFKYINKNDSLSQTQNNTSNHSSGYNLANDILFRHSFKKKGRTFSINIYTGIGKHNARNYLGTNTTFFQNTGSSSVDSLNQLRSLNSNGYYLSSNLVYTEPIERKSELEVSYRIRYNQHFSNRGDNNFNPSLHQYSNLDTTLSNTLNNNYFTNTVGLAFRHKTKYNLFFTFGLNYQKANLINHQTFPVSNHLFKSFGSILPHALIRYKISHKNNLRVYYRSQTNAPSINQLQRVQNNTNPLFLSIGNSNLKQETSHLLITRFSHVNHEKSKGFYVFLYANQTNNYIGNSITFVNKDTTLSDGTTLNSGAQLTEPVNLNGYWRLHSSLTYALPISFISSNINFNAGFSFTHTPELFNNISNISNSYDESQGIEIGSSINKNIDFTLAYTAHYDNVKNAIQPNLDNQYYYHRIRVKCVLTFWRGIMLRNNLVQQLYSGLSDNYFQQYTLWDAAIGKKIFKNHHGEISLSVFDLLNQNKSINRIITNTYLQNQVDETLHRYFLFTFMYKI